jgi:hypothetical protein
MKMSPSEELQKCIGVLERLDSTGADIITLLPKIREKLYDATLSRDAAVALAKILVDGLEQSFEESKIRTAIIIDVVNLLTKYTEKLRGVVESVK